MFNLDSIGELEDNPCSSCVQFAFNLGSIDAELVIANQIRHKVTQFLPLPEQSEAQWITLARKIGQGKMCQQLASLEQGAQG